MIPDEQGALFALLLTCGLTIINHFMLLAILIAVRPKVSTGEGSKK